MISKVKILSGIVVVVLAGCGGGGGGGGTTPPPQARVETYAVQLQAVMVRDSLTNQPISVAGLPIASAVVSVQQ